jgi:colanic acid biosynthesis glycosyl transferase WcaI
MKLILIADRYAPEARAAAYLFRELAEGLSRRGHEVTVLTRYPTGFVPAGEGGIPMAEVLNGVNVIRVASFSSSSWLPLRALDQCAVFLRILWHLLRSRGLDAALVSSPPLPLTLASVIKKKLHGTPYVIHLHDLYPQTAIDLGILKNRPVIWLMRCLERAAYLNSAGIIAAAPETLRVLKECAGLPGNHVTLVHNFVNLRHCEDHNRSPAFRERLKIGREYLILYAGLMGYAQDMDLILECARRCRHRPDWRFVLAGDGPRAGQIRAAAAALPNVQFVGCLPNQEYFEALQAADVCLVTLDPALKVPAVPGKVPTIMASGKPFVASVPEGNDTRGVATESQSGLVINAGSAYELTEALDLLYRKPELRNEMGARGKTYAQEHFSLEGALVKFERELKLVAENLPVENPGRKVIQ